MKKTGTEAMRKAFGLSDVEGYEDHSVLKRRRFHVAAAGWLARWMYYLQALFLIIGLVFLLLPVLGLDWYPLVMGLPASYVLANNFNALFFCFFFLFIIGTILNIILGFNVKNYPGGWNPTQQFGFPNPRQVVDLELYPKTRKEEFVFWVDYFFGLLISTWPLLAISLVSFFIVR